MESEKKARRKLTPVQVLSQSGEAALVEYEAGGIPERVTIPAEAVEDGKADKSALIAGVAYGEDWSALMPTPTDYLLALRKAGIWTEEDLRKDPNRAASILSGVAPRVNRIIRDLEEAGNG